MFNQAKSKLKLHSSSIFRTARKRYICISTVDLNWPISSYIKEYKIYFKLVLLQVVYLLLINT